MKRFDLLNERLDLIRTIKQTELGMEVEMNEGRSHGRILGAEEGEVKRCWDRRYFLYSQPGIGSYLVDFDSVGVQTDRAFSPSKYQHTWWDSIDPDLTE